MEHTGNQGIVDIRGNKESGGEMNLEDLPEWNGVYKNQSRVENVWRGLRPAGD